MKYRRICQLHQFRQLRQERKGAKEWKGTAAPRGSRGEAQVYMPKDLSISSAAFSMTS